ncbi:hypothetical protein ACXJY6_16930 [Vibrio sp. RC27]
MFVTISILISLAILGLMLYQAKQRNSTLQRKYELLIGLRQTLFLCRQHRRATHHTLMFGEERNAEVSQLQESMQEKTAQLIATANVDSKPMYRVLQLKLNTLIKDWDQRSVSNNQIIHGKSIRHCMFLMDEVVLSWLVDVNRIDLSDEYHMNWQQVIDTMDALTQLRVCIEDMNSSEGRLRLIHYSESICRKLNQLALINSLMISSPTCANAIKFLSDINDDLSTEFDAEEMYQITADISLTVANVYDQMLSDLTESLYIPLPKLLTTSDNAA